MECHFFLFDYILLKHDETSGQHLNNLRCWTYHSVLCFQRTREFVNDTLCLVRWKNTIDNKQPQTGKEYKQESPSLDKKSEQKRQDDKRQKRREPTGRK